MAGQVDKLPSAVADAGHASSGIWGQVLAPDWSKFYPRAALLLVPAVALPLSAGIATGHVDVGVLVAAGAFTVGFGSFQQLGVSRLRPMLLAACGMCVSSWIGTLAGLTQEASVLAAGCAAGVYALLSRYGQAKTWDGLQCSIWLVISTAYPAHGVEALHRGALILSGGILQSAIFAISWRIGCTRTWSDSASECFPTANPAPTTQALSISRAVITVGVAAVIYKWWGPQNGYWIPMTALIVLRPAFQQTAQRGVARIIGTMAGASLATIIVEGADPGQWALALGIVLSVWASYTLLNVNYAYFAVFLTAYVVFLLSLAGLSPRPLIEHRIAFTAIGGTLAFLTHLLWANKAYFVRRLPRLSS